MTRPSGTPAIPADLLDRVEARIEALRPPQPAKRDKHRPRYGPLHEAAAVLGWFDVETIRPVPGKRPEAMDDLLVHSVRAVGADGLPNWALEPDVRISVLRQLRARERWHEALAVNADQVHDPVRETFEAYCNGVAEPIEQQTLAQLVSTQQVCEWLRAAGFPALPEPDVIERRTEWLTLIEPFEHLAGRHFRGRVSELQKLREHVGVLAPGVGDAPAPSAEGPPLVISGPGGVGKSTLLARFILEHARALERDRFPFAYLDFDRPDVDASKPLTLLIEALRQLAIEYPDAARGVEHIRAGWLQLIATADPPVRTLSAAVRDFVTLLNSLGAGKRPVLFVLDTFEEIQWHSEEHVNAVWELLDMLQRATSRIRIVVAGRGDLSGRTRQELRLAGLDEEAAVGYLQARGVADQDVARRLARMVGGSPLSLKLAADLIEREGLEGSKFDTLTRESLFVTLDDAVLQRQLYTRVLGFVHDEDVRKLAHPGLVLRRLTPELILEVLAEPCELAISSFGEAEQLFEKLQREVALVTVAADGALLHRQDLRRLMLELIEHDEPIKARRIRELAVAYYERRPARPQERAEEIYHRLALGQEAHAIDQRWIRGVEPFLASAVEEFTGARLAYLAARLGLNVDEETRRLADVEDWERIVSRKARSSLDQDKPESALSLLGSRPDRSAASPVYALQAEALRRLSRHSEAQAVLESGIEQSIQHGEHRLALTLALQQAEIVLVAGHEDDIARVRERVDRLMKSAAARPGAERLDALAHRIALARRGNDVALEDELRVLFDATADNTLVTSPRLARWVAAQFRCQDAVRLSRVLRLTGVPRTNETAVRQLAATLGTFDLGMSREAAETPGILARRYGVPMRDSLTASWGSFILSAGDKQVREALSGLLEHNAESVTDPLAESFAMLMRVELGVEGLVTEPPPSTIVQPQDSAGRLTGVQRQALVNALLDIFSTADELRNFLRSRVDLSLDAISPVASQQVMVFEVVQYAEEHGFLSQLITRAREVAPAHRGLIQASEAVGIGTIVGTDPSTVPRSGVRRGFLDPATWATRLSAIEGQVCRIEAGSDIRSTGFLIGPNIVLTADHGLPEGHSTKIRVRFDYKRDRRGTTITPGTVFDAGNVIARRPYGTGENELGYALLEVLGGPGTQPVGGERVESDSLLRHWIHIPDPPTAVSIGDGLVMVQHPSGGPLRLSMNSAAVAAINPARTHIDYWLDTESGSAGAPVFTEDLELVAMHLGRRLGAEITDSVPGFGVLTAAVVEDLRRQGYGEAVGAVLA